MPYLKCPSDNKPRILILKLAIVYHRSFWLWFQFTDHTDFIYFILGENDEYPFLEMASLKSHLRNLAKLRLCYPSDECYLFALRKKKYNNLGEYQALQTKSWITGLLLLLG